MIYPLKRLLIPFLVFVIIYIYLTNYSTNNTNQELKKLIKCSDKNFDFYVDERGSFWVLKNFIKAEHGPLKCYESITYSTTTDIKCIQNVILIAERWKAPISLALYTPNYVYENALNSIFYLRNCLPQSSLIRKYVTFHIFFKLSERPNSIWINESFNCEDDPPYSRFKRYLKSNETFPINVGRNIASSASLTHFHLRCDSELFPSENLVSKFFDYILNNKGVLKRRSIFIVPAFEIPLNESTIPFTMLELKNHFQVGKIIFFFDLPELCNFCFKFPNKQQWVSEMLENNKLRTHFNTKRLEEYKSIEHFYIGTENDPLYPEELTWNMRNDKMAHEYVMCLLGYEYYFLAGAFLVHSPGYHSTEMKKLLNFNNLSWNIFEKELKPAYDLIYGKREGCVLR
ncbi:hypothetical protein ACFFRR_000031 [Megaselia abdita]